MAAMAVFSQGEANVVGGTAAPPVTLPQTSVGVGGVLINNSSLYVGDLDPSVDERQLFDLFGQVAEVASIRVCRDQTKHSSLGYAYVNFNTQRDAAHAREVLNFTPINGKPIRIMFSHRDPTIRKTGYANVFIKNLDASIDNKALHDTFSAFGNILSCKVAVNSNGKSKGYGFVQYDHEEAAQNAIKQLNGMLLNDKQVYVGLFVRQQYRIGTIGSQKFTNIYVKNLPKTTTAEDLQKIFEKYGAITSSVVMTDANGKSRCFGFINFRNAEDAASAVENMNAASLSDKVLYVGKAQRKAEREAELKAKFEQQRIARFEKLKGANLYIKNLDDNITDEKLKDLFSSFGTITSCKVLVDSQGLSKGFGFVAFSSPEEAKNAMNEMNGKMIGKKPLYVAIAQRKDERRARLQAYFAQVQGMPGGITSLPAGVPGFLHGVPRVPPPHVYLGQPAPGLVQPQSYGFQQQLLPGVRPGVAPGFIMPYQLQRQGPPVQRLGGNPHEQQQHNAAQGMSRYAANAQNGAENNVVPQGLIGSMMQLPFDASGIPITSLDIRHSGYLDIRHSGPMAASALATTIASASPENQRMILGEEIFPLVEPLVHEHASKITGMLLEMDQNELLHLIESPEALKEKVAEAMEVLRLSS